MVAPSVSFGVLLCHRMASPITLLFPSCLVPAAISLVPSVVTPPTEMGDGMLLSRRHRPVLRSRAAAVDPASPVRGAAVTTKSLGLRNPEPPWFRCTRLRSRLLGVE
jgi:hypothetical protein